MTDMPIPAPLWRRLAAALYDVLLLLGLWLGALLVMVIPAGAAELRLPAALVRAVLFLLSFGFFGWFWTHGGQTLGMRAWRLQLRRLDGAPLSWPQSMLRFVAAIPSWGLAGLGMLWCLVDRNRRGWHDLVAGTEVIVLPQKTPAQPPAPQG